MEAFVKSRKVKDLSWKDNTVVGESIDTEIINDYSGEIDVELQLNEKDERNCELGKQASLSSTDGNNWIRAAEVAFTSRSHDGSTMISPVLDVKIESENTSTSSLDSCEDSIIKKKFDPFSDEDETMWMKENEQFLMQNSDSMKMEIDSFAEDIGHDSAEMVDNSNLKDVYCKYCKDNVLTKSLKSHWTEYHKDSCNIGKIKKYVQCSFCGNDVFSKNLIRHLERLHNDESEVQKILAHPKNSRERRLALSLFRNSINFDLLVKGEVPPNSLVNGENASKEYFPCAHCKGVYKRKYLKQHRKFCYHREKKSKTKKQQKKSGLSPNCRSKVKCDADHVTLISRLNVKDQVFHLMKQDLISLAAKRDVVIVHVGEHYWNNEKDAHVKHTIINKMRELSCLLIAYRSLVKKKNLSFIDIINPKNFNKVVKTVKTIAGYDYNMKTFHCPNLATNIGDSLKLACTILVNLILKENLVRSILVDKIDWIREVIIFKNLVETHWNAALSLSDDIELSENIDKKPSLTHIPIDSKQESSKPIKVQILYSLLHLAVHLKHFHEEVLKIAFQCQQELFTDTKNDDAYRLMVQSSLALLCTSSMRNVKDIQYIMIKHYLNDTGVGDFENNISNIERLLSTKHKHILILNDEDEKVSILIPYIIESFISVILTHRDKYINEDNKYIFAIPGSDTEWGDSEVAIRNLCEIIKLEEESIGSDRFRKYTAIIMSILNLSQAELQQLDHYMRCVLESDQNFFEFPLDAYQLAKFARLLQMMEEESILSKYKGKCLTEIDIDPNNEYASFDVAGEMEDVTSNNIEYVDVVEKCTDAEKYQQCLDNVNETVEISEHNKKSSPNRNNNRSLQNKKTDSSTTLGKFYDKAAGDNLQRTASNIGNKRGWKNEEIELIEKEYSHFIKNGVYPSGREMSKFLMENNMTKTVPILRSKIQHLIRMKNNN